MPTYEFKCNSCNEKFDAYQSFKEYDDNKQESCVICGSSSHRLITTPMHCHVKDIKTIGQLAEINTKRDWNKIQEEDAKKEEKRIAGIKASLPAGASISKDFGKKKEKKSLDLSKIVGSDGVEKIGDISDGKLDKNVTQKLNDYITKGTI